MNSRLLCLLSARWVHVRKKPKGVAVERHLLWGLLGRKDEKGEKERVVMCEFERGAVRPHPSRARETSR